MLERVNKLRLEQYKKHKPVDFAKTEKVVYEKYKAVLHGANVEQITRKNASAWKSFFTLSKKKKEGELPKWMKPKPPHKKKDDLFLLIRNDRYKIEGNEIYLLDFNLRLKFTESSSGLASRELLKYIMIAQGGSGTQGFL
ncbi:MAG: hypothetical protein RXR36_05715 [Nitrososphaeria archaeon]